MKVHEDIGVGLIGTGVTLRTHLPAFRRTGKAKILGLVGSNRERAQAFAAEHDIPQALGDYRQLCELPGVDLMVVATPNSLHYDQVLYALQQGKHVLAEKPLAMTMPEIESLVSAADATPRLALIDHQLRFHPYFRKIRQLIQDGRLGRPYFIRIHFQGGSNDPQRGWSWHFDERMGGGIRLAMASHLLDLLWFWLGPRKVFHVHGAMDALVPQRKDAQGTMRHVRTAGFFTAHLSMEANLEVQFSDTMAFGAPQFEIAIYGTEGELYFDPQNALRGAFLDDKGVVKAISIDDAWMSEVRQSGSVFRQAFDLFAPRLVEAILTDDPEPVSDAATFEQAIPTQVVLDAIRESAVEGRLVKLNEGYRPAAWT